MRANKCFVSVDLGGTKILISLIDVQSLNVINSLEIATPRDNTAEQIIKLIAKNILEVIQNNKTNLVGIGVASTGIVRDKKIQYSVNLPFRNFGIGAILEEKFSVPVIVENDARAASIGEYFLGVGKNQNWHLMVYIIISTGVGGAIVEGGELLTGVSNNAGEFGHTKISLSGSKCRCKKRGCVDAYASGYAIQKYISDFEKRNNIPISSKSVKEIAQNARKGDKLSLKAFTRVANSLGLLISNIIQEYNPNAIILDGGLIGCKDIFWKNMIGHAKQNCFPEAWENSIITTGQLGKISGSIGIAYLLRNHIYSVR